MRQVLFYIARHGTSEDSGKNIFRGQRDAALDRKGFNDAHELKKFFADKTWSYIFRSTLKRASQTAIIIADGDESKIATGHVGLLPWNIGYLTGKPKDQYGKDMDVFIEHPDMVPKFGESRNEFEHERVFPLLLEAMHIGLTMGPPIIIGHSSVIHALGHLLYGDTGQEPAVQPGGVIEVYLEDGEVKEEAVLKAGKDDSSYSPTS